MIVSVIVFHPKHYAHISSIAMLKPFACREVAKLNFVMNHILLLFKPDMIKIFSNK